jgi:NADH-quinone oxidoreductase subunit J
MSKSIITILLMLVLVNSLCVVLVQNSFFALLFLILSFLTVSLIFLILECEFFALLILILYVGATIILILFVLIMLETKLKKVSKGL